MEKLISPTQQAFLDNLNSPSTTFTKLELASLMMAQGLLTNPKIVASGNEIAADIPVKLAKAILQEANK